MWYVTSRTISAGIVSIRIRRMSPHRQSSTRQTYSVVVTDRWKDGQIDRNATLCGLYLCSVTRLPQYTIIFSHCPVTAVHQHTTERPHRSLLEFVNRMRYVTSRVIGMNDRVNSIRHAAEWWLAMHSRPDYWVVIRAPLHLSKIKCQYIVNCYMATDRR